MWKNNISPDSKYSSELNQLLDYRKDNLDEIKKLENRSALKSKIKVEKLKFLKKNQVSIDKDVSELRNGQEFPCVAIITKVKKEIHSFNENIDSDQEINTYDNNILDSLNYHKIQRIADKVLTDKQKVIFYLHFENQLQQEEIADIVDDTQGHVSRDIKKIIEKIKKNL